jgi:hypothetical protein
MLIAGKTTGTTLWTYGKTQAAFRVKALTA